MEIPHRLPVRARPPLAAPDCTSRLATWISRRLCRARPDRSQTGCSATLACDGSARALFEMNWLNDGALLYCLAFPYSSFLLL